MAGPPRGRLIQRFLVGIYRLDTEATSLVAGGGYDPVFGEALPAANGSQEGAPSRREHPVVELPCQVDRRDWDQDRINAGGHDPDIELMLTLHFKDLEAAGLVHSATGFVGNPMIGPGDRIGYIKRTSGLMVVKFPGPPGGVYVVQPEQAGFGLHCMGVPQRNLLILHCRSARRGNT